MLKITKNFFVVHLKVFKTLDQKKKKKHCAKYMLKGYYPQIYHLPFILYIFFNIFQICLFIHLFVITYLLVNVYPESSGNLATDAHVSGVTVYKTNNEQMAVENKNIIFIWFIKTIAHEKPLYDYIHIFYSIY